MQPIRFALACVLGLVALLVACADRGATVMGASPAGGCHAAGAQAVLGQRFDDHIMQEALRDSGALRSRILPPGSATSAGDVDPMRLNIELDAQGHIRRMQCG